MSGSRPAPHGGVRGELESAPPVLAGRRAGVVLHPTSLDTAGRGVLGQRGVDFIDFLAAAGFGLWQVLPLGPTHADHSPYQCMSVHAGNPSLVDIDDLVRRGWVHGDAVTSSGLRGARERFERVASAADRVAFEDFVQAQRWWLDDYALFASLREAHRRLPWWQWPRELRHRQPGALATARCELAAEIADRCFEQFVFTLQWRGLREHAHAAGVLLFGDVPIFVAWDSADTWARPEQFQLTEEGHPRVVAGVPPDYFSPTGQRWGNPVYDWQRMRDDGFAWWTDRLRTQLAMFDALRVDHFRGFAASWEIPAAAATAINGRWVEGPGAALFDALHAALGGLPLVAEDLGTITPDVIALRLRLGIPGMKVLQFAFGGDASNPYLPHAHERNSVVYTGTHDNDTTLAWARSLSAAVLSHAANYLGCEPEPRAVSEALCRAALASVAQWALLPMQDVLGLGEGHRMNTPGTVQGNWRWCLPPDALSPELAETMRARNGLYARTRGEQWA